MPVGKSDKNKQKIDEQKVETIFKTVYDGQLQNHFVL